MVDIYDIFLHVLFILGIAISIYVLIGLFTRRFGEQHYQSSKHYWPLFVFPRNERNYVIVLKVLVVFGLICMIVGYGLTIRFVL